MAWPDDYKVDTMIITKFERDMKSQMTYKFINAFPKTIVPISVAYGGAELLKVNVTFTFDRYLVGNYSNRKDNVDSSTEAAAEEESTNPDNSGRIQQLKVLQNRRGLNPVETQELKNLQK